MQIAKELLDTALEYFNGIYLITPFMFYDMTVQLTDYVWRKTGRLTRITSFFLPFTL